MIKIFPKIGIVYLSYSGGIYADDVISALEKISYPKDKIEFIIVDNPHPRHGSSSRVLSEKFMPLSGKTIPAVTIISQKENLGFAAGNNVGMEWALANGCDYVYLHNEDGFMAADCLTILVEVMEQDARIGAAQSLVLFYPETDLVNSAGNKFNYLGFGYCDKFRHKKEELKIEPIEKNIGYASGASLILRAELLKKYGLLETELFLYHEDLEYSLRLKSVGLNVALARNAVFYHKYQFSRNKEKFFFMERNRYVVMLMYFSYLTLAVIFPMAIFMELGIIFFAWQNGWLKEKMKAYKYWFNLKNIKYWLAKRKIIRNRRVVKDKELLKNASAEIVFNEKSIQHPLLVFVANPLMGLYWLVIKYIIIW